jgi:hypothetical protein
MEEKVTALDEKSVKAHEGPVMIGALKPAVIVVLLSSPKSTIPKGLSI